jgi:galactokinase
MAHLVPQFTTLKDVYSASEDSLNVSPEHETRFKGLLSKFSATFGEKPEFVARSPGRVNIIGEHIDYSLYNVLPAAVTVDVLIAVRSISSNQEGPSIQCANVNPGKYPTREIKIPHDGIVEVDNTAHDWSNYFRAGLKGTMEFLRKKHGDGFKPQSMEVLLDGNVPAGGGLSSSAAFVCASALAVMKANGHDVSKQDLLDLAIVSERSVGVFSGGMDQAASIFSERGFLLYCRFYPTFKEEHIPMPKAEPDVTFLVAQSFVTSDKAVTAPKHYNLRVVECTLATVVLAKLHDISLNPDESSLGFCLRNFQQEYMKKQGSLDLPLEDQVNELVDVAQEGLSQQSYTREDISKILGIDVPTLENTYMSKFPIQATDFLLRQRATHVLHEARRVIFFKNTLTNSKTLNSATLEYLGGLMNETQHSCKDIYECSCPELDEICAIARRAGTYGSRLTGAGWGGCTVHLLPTDKVSAVTEALKKEYYFKKFPDITEEKLREAIVISKPSQGSSVIAGAALEV